MRLNLNHLFSEDMGNVSLLVGKHCMELSEVILSLSSSYTLLTSDLVNHDSVCTYPDSIQIVTLSGEDMQQFLSFFFENKSLNKIGLSESSLLFIAKRRDIKIAVVDTLTQRICDELGIETINIQRKVQKVQKNPIDTTFAPAPLLNLFKVAACL